ncbi:MAG: HlyD family efflux transporter periplasmic adaptor subunit [Clostridiales bacterium]|nr:HlyD family efflux transporter periplasmic adaptor subunit [Clostridiales bacterium]
MKEKKRTGFTRKKIIALVIVVLVLAGTLYSCSRAAEKRNAAAQVSVTALKKGSLRDTVSVSGEVKSNASRNVYTTLNYPVKEVKVKVGDTVKAGQVLAVLDTATLESDIEDAQNAADNARQSAALTLQKAKSDYENALYLYNNNLNMDLVNANDALVSARQALDAAEAKYEKDHNQAALDAAQSAYDKANTTLAFTKNKVSQDLKTLKNNYDAAALKASDRTQQDNLDKLRQNLKMATITAPAAGTVTACGAVAGAPVTGVLFTIQDTSSLMVSAEIREYDVDGVKAGKKAVLKTDATGDDEIAAVVSSVAPAATQGTEGSGSVTYTAEVKIEKQDPRLKIGMKARLSIVLSEKSNVYSVPYDAVLHKDDGSAYVLIAEKDEKGVLRAREQPVSTGLETDISIEISGSGLKDGLQVVGNPDNITAGSALKL